EPGVWPAQVARPTPVKGLDVIPGNKDLDEFPVRVASDPGRALLLRRKLSGLAGYDCLVFDAPPSRGLPTLNILTAAACVVGPGARTYLSLDGAAEIVETVDRIRAEHESERLRVALVISTLYRKTALADEILSKLHEHFGDRVCRTALGYSVAIDEAQSFGRT